MEQKIISKITSLKEHYKNNHIPRFKEGSQTHNIYTDVIVNNLDYKEALKKYKVDEEKLYGLLRWLNSKIEKKIGFVVKESEKIIIDRENIDMSKFIPTHDGNYIAKSIAGKRDIAILQKAYEEKKNVLLFGDTGTGKTHSIRHLAHKLQKPYMRVNLNGATTPEDLVGQFIPSGDGYKWQDGVLTLFMRYGGFFICDEINACPADILFLLHGILDDERRIVLTQHDGEVIKANQDFWFVATMNPDYEGTKPLNLALKDRFDIKLYYDYSDKVEEGLNINKKLMVVANKLRIMFREGELITPVSTRTLLQYMNNVEMYGERVAREVFLNNFDLSEKKAVGEVLEVELDNVRTYDVKEDEDEAEK